MNALPYSDAAKDALTDPLFSGSIVEFQGKMVTDKEVDAWLETQKLHPLKPVLIKGMKDDSFNEDVYKDGNYNARVMYYGRMWYFSFVNNEMKLRGTFSQYERSNTWQAKAARKALEAFFRDRVASFGPEFMEAHKRTYA